MTINSPAASFLVPDDPHSTLSVLTHTVSYLGDGALFKGNMMSIIFLLKQWNRPMTPRLGFKDY